VGALLTRSAPRYPSKFALTFQGRRWTYAELDLAAGRVAAGLHASGLNHGDRVAAFGRNSDAYLLQDCRPGLTLSLKRAYYGAESAAGSV
jgi:fatty-acyl-CoA synthase